MTPSSLKVLLFLSCAATSISASILINPNRIIDCSDDRVILHPHPTDCTLYLQCEHGNVIERPCAPGTEFSPSLGQCVHSWQSDCQASEPETTEEPSTETTETDGTTPSGDDITSATEGSANYLSPDDDIDGHIDSRANFNFCAPDRFFLMATEENCATYVICNYGEAIFRQCPRGEFFDSWSKTCSRNHRAC